MARKVEAFVSKDGTIHAQEIDADRADAEHDLNVAAVELAAAIRPAYGDEDQLVCIIEWRRIGNDATRIAGLEAHVANLEARLLAVENRHDRIDRAR